MRPPATPAAGSTSCRGASTPRWTPGRSSSTGSTSTRRRSPTCRTGDAPSSATSTPAPRRTGGPTRAGTPRRSSAIRSTAGRASAGSTSAGLDVISPILAERFDMCRSKGFTGVEADNVDGYTQDSGFELTDDDQLSFNRMIAELAHERSLTIGLKNDLDQIDDLVDDFDFAVNESCVAVPRVRRADPVRRAGKAGAARRVRAGHGHLLPRHGAAGVPVDPQAGGADGAGRAVPRDRRRRRTGRVRVAGRGSAGA